MDVRMPKAGIRAAFELDGVNPADRLGEFDVAILSGIAEMVTAPL
jgi:hypothetical protein